MTALHQQNIPTPAMLTKWLSVELVTDPNDPTSISLIAKKQDPKCRFMYV
jgi:hypothetical protein